MVNLLLSHKTALDASADTESPLHLAAEGGHKEMIKILLNAGAPVNAADELGRTPLHRHLSSRTRRKEIVDLLLAGGADVNAVDANHRSVLDEAAQHNPRHPLAELLRKKGARER